MLDSNIWKLFIDIGNAFVLFALYCVLQTMTEMAIELRKVFFSQNQIFSVSVESFYGKFNSTTSNFIVELTLNTNASMKH